MNILEAIEAMSKGFIVAYGYQKHRMKITSWANTRKEDDEPEWNVFYYCDFDNEWIKNNEFSLEEILSNDWHIVEEGEDY